ncbi:hypothetical protein [Streptomyces xiaopingdaonensis]|uniref:hypothetical protein n=1 Tax=Streptomyces xiaopingdaonensis TaxID=1565415 RepID=UPI0002D38A7A|nr:hypothetical protein [Streptomyces xiaopingdaonensis]
MPHETGPEPRRPQPAQSRQGGVPDGLLLAVLAFLLGLTLFTWTATGISGLLSHGAWPDGVTFGRTPLALRELVTEPHDLAGAWPDTPPSQLSGYGLFWGIFIGHFLVLTVFTVFALGTVARARAARAAHRARKQHLTEIQQSPDSPQPDTEPEAPTAVPSLTKQPPAASEAADPSDDARLRILEAPGAVLVATDDPTLWAGTKDARAKIGPVHLFDPTHLCDTPDRLRWSPHHGCADRAAATSRAAALLAPLRSPRPIDATTHTAAETLLRCWLQAAALDERPFREVHRWAQARTPATEPVQTLRTHPKAAPGTAGELESLLTGHPRLRQDATELVRAALSPLDRLHVRDSCTARRADRIALESFLDELGTLYVVGNEPQTMPLLNALTQCVVEHGRRMAARSSPGRLDPPLTTVLPLPGLDLA